MVEPRETVRGTTVEGGIAIGIVTEFCVDVARRVRLASSIAFTHSWTSCGVDA